MIGTLGELEWIVRLLAALLFGGIVGFEREIKGKAAGLRTNMLVALGAAGYTLVAVQMTNNAPDGDWVSVDPSRILQGIAGGIGFLGAGAIIQSRGDVRGLTTAAAIWVSGAVGVLAGLGLYLHAFAITLGTILVLWIVGVIENNVGPEGEG